MMCRIAVLLLVPVIHPLWMAPAEARNGGDNDIDEMLRGRIEAVGQFPGLSIGSEVIHASTALPRFYESRGFQPAWSRNGSPDETVNALMDAIRAAELEGLRPSDYHLERIEDITAPLAGKAGGAEALPAALLVDLDLLCTDAFLVYGSHLLSGRVNPETIDPEWKANRRDGDMAAVLKKALAGIGIGVSLEGLLPKHPGYARLRALLQRYRVLAEQGGWPAVPPGPKLQPGASDTRVPVLRRRLATGEDFGGKADDTADFYDPELEMAVRSFQERHGLDVDGVVGPATLAALNIGIEERIRQIILNLERWRWLPQDLGGRHILVNIPSYTARVYEKERIVLEMRAIVGRPYRRTPVFSDLMTYLVLCPYWEVPTNIAVSDKLPEIRKDVGYLAAQKMRVLRGWGTSEQQIDPSTIDWAALGKGNFPYRLRQDPGPMNALGLFKFMFPNKYNVYLHDTPSRELFAKPERGFSSGCIRIQRPLDLAAYLLGDQPEWTPDNILKETEENSPRTIPLATPIPVHLLYWTAWVEEDGAVHFRPDVYNRDDGLYEALRETPPGP